jgi:hypothetical protein
MEQQKQQIVSKDTSKRVTTIEDLSPERIAMILILRNMSEFRSASFIMFSRSRQIDQYTHAAEWWSFKPLWQTTTSSSSRLFKKLGRGLYELTESGKKALKLYEHLDEKELLKKHYSSRYNLKTLKLELEKLEREVDEGGAK